MIDATNPWGLLTALSSGELLRPELRLLLPGLLLLG
jgi:hypothetical protein